MSLDAGAATQWAKALIEEFGSLKAVLAATPVDQARVLGPASPAVAHLGTIRAAMLHVLKTEALGGPVLSDSQALLDYLMVDMAHAREERFRVLYLNSGNFLLKDETMGGSVTEAPVYPREIIRRALELGATALILIHNHPSGDPGPSRDDINLTADMAAAANLFGICIHDHLLITRTGHTSFRASGYL